MLKNAPQLTIPEGVKNSQKSFGLSIVAGSWSSPCPLPRVRALRVVRRRPSFAPAASRPTLHDVIVDGERWVSLIGLRVSLTYDLRRKMGVFDL